MEGLAGGYWEKAFLYAARGPAWPGRNEPLGDPAKGRGFEVAMQAAPPRVCPRCRGSMIMEEDWYGSYSSCLCCGYVHEFGAMAVEELQAEEGAPHRQRRRQPSHGKLRL